MSELLSLEQPSFPLLRKSSLLKRSYTTSTRHIYSKVDYVFPCLNPYFHIWVSIDKCLLYLILHIILILILYEFDINLNETGLFTLNYIMRSREVRKYEIWYVCNIFADKFKKFKSIMLSSKAETGHHKIYSLLKIQI